MSFNLEKYMDISPGFLLILLFFMMSPIIKSGELNEKSAKALASLVVAMFTMVPFLALYFICVTILGIIFK